MNEYWLSQLSDVHLVIKTAFAGMPRPVDPRGFTLHRCSEGDRIARDLAPYDFDVLPEEIIEHHSNALRLLGPEAFQHYLPAWLLYALDHPASAVMMSTISQLAPSKHDIVESDAYFQGRFGRLTQAQREAISAFFTHIRDHRLYEGFGKEFERAAELWRRSKNRAERQSYLRRSRGLPLSGLRRQYERA